MAFTKATRRQAKLRMAIAGPSGSGKTYTALAIATALARGGTVAAIDTERGSASKYSGGKPFDFDVDEPTTFNPAAIPGKIKDAVSAGYAVLLIDSLSHYWMGAGGALELHDQAVKRGGKDFQSWGDVTPVQNAMIDAILAAPIHVIITMRTKTEYVLELNEKGKQVPRKIGTAPVQRSGVEYEFDVVGDLDETHSMTISKTRCSEIADRVWTRPGRELADILAAWLGDGSPAPASPPPAATTAAPAVQAPTQPISTPAPTGAPSPVTEAKALIDAAAQAGPEKLKELSMNLKPFCDRAGKGGDAAIREYYRAAKARITPTAPAVQA